MTDISLNQYDQTIVVEGGEQPPVVLRSYTQELVIDPADGSTTVVHAGPVGPAGPAGQGGIPAPPNDGQPKVVVDGTWENGNDYFASDADLTDGLASKASISFTLSHVSDSIAAHDQADLSHDSKSSGRDFSALFTLGIT